MKTNFHMAAVLFGFCVTIASSLPIADGVLIHGATTGDARMKRAPSNSTRINDDDPGGDYTCFGTLEALQTDCSSLVQNMEDAAAAEIPDYLVAAHECLSFNSGACLAKFCANSDLNVTASAQWIANQLTLLDNSCATQNNNGVMAPCSDDSFTGSCAWWNLWLESEPNLVTTGNPLDPPRGPRRARGRKTVETFLKGIAERYMVAAVL
ncbi:uncharacterized protein PG998_001938 [Apiospora kogelbergensis]|uniref:uncharacterized protein n=1 Tax=Apiospora kogelbergensis TaxID=1337665 RepID=UPI0031321364